MFLHYETLTINGKKIVAVDIQQGTERPYYIAKKGLRPEGVYVRQGYSSVPATNTAIRRMIKETDGDHFEEMRSLEQNLTFESAKKNICRTSCKVCPGTNENTWTGNTGWCLYKLGAAAFRPVCAYN